MQENEVRVDTGRTLAGVTEASNSRAKEREPDWTSNKVDDSAVRFPFSSQQASWVWVALNPSPVSQ